jgi:hypothetical protein
MASSIRRFCDAKVFGLLTRHGIAIVCRVRIYNLNYTCSFYTSLVFNLSCRIVSLLVKFFHQHVGNTIAGDANSIQIGSGTNIQDNSIVHVAKSNLSGKVFPTIIGDNVTVGKYVLQFFA